MLRIIIHEFVLHPPLELFATHKEDGGCVAMYDTHAAVVLGVLIQERQVHDIYVVVRVQNCLGFPAKKINYSSTIEDTICSRGFVITLKNNTTVRKGCSRHYDIVL